MELLETARELLDFICDELYFGYKIDSNITKYGCSAFSTETIDNKHLFGRNFDLNQSSVLSVYTNPKKGYASISSVSLDMLSVGRQNKITETSMLGKIAMLASPYIAVDGVNEKGLAASLLDTDVYGETHMNTNKPDILVTIAIRLLLDKAANVDEAIKLLEKYDINTSHGWTQHIFVSDKSGNSAIIEWENDEMKVIKYNVCTNFRMADLTDYSTKCDRFDFLDSSLKENDKNSIEESFKYLKGAKQKNTVWSVVFNLDDFSASYAIDGDYDNIYHLSKKDF